MRKIVLRVLIVNLLVALVIAIPRVAHVPAPHSAPVAAIAWPLPFAPAATWTHSKFFRQTADGAIEIDYATKYGNAGWTFNAVTTAQYCLAAYAQARGGDLAMRTAAVRAARALVARATPVGGGEGFRYGFAVGPQRMNPGWVSSMAQGLAMGCEAGAYALSGDRSFLGHVARLHAVIVAPYGASGTAARFGRGTYYEEYAGAPGAPSHTLNGMLYTLAGLWFVNAVDPHPAYARAFEDGANAVRSTIDLYDAPGASLYDQGVKSFAPIGGYNMLHVSQLHWLYERTGDAHLEKMALQFFGYERRITFVSRLASGRTTQPGGRFFPIRGAVPLTAVFRGPRQMDRVQIIMSERTPPPATIVVRAGAITRTVHPASRFVDLNFGQRTIASASITFVPQQGRAVAASLVTFTNTRLRALAAVSSDPARTHDALALYDGDPSTRWSSDQDSTELTVRLGDAQYKTITAQGCVRAPGFAWSQSADLVHWSPQTPAPPTEIVRLPASRYVRFTWARGRACLAGLGGAA